MALASSVQNSNAQVVDSKGLFQALDDGYLRQMGYEPGPAIATGLVRVVGAALVGIGSTIEAGVYEVGARAPLISRIHVPCMERAERAKARVTSAVKHLGRGLSEAVGGGPLLKRFDAKNKALEVLQAAKEDLTSKLHDSEVSVMALNLQVEGLEKDLKVANGKIEPAVTNQKTSADAIAKLEQEKNAAILDLQNQLFTIRAQIDALKARKEELEKQNAVYAGLIAQPDVAKVLRNKNLAASIPAPLTVPGA